jgi:hypothetical protein
MLVGWGQPAEHEFSRDTPVDTYLLNAKYALGVSFISRIYQFHESSLGSITSHTNGKEAAIYIEEYKKGNRGDTITGKTTAELGENRELAEQDFIEREYWRSHHGFFHGVFRHVPYGFRHGLVRMLGPAVLQVLVQRALPQTRQHLLAALFLGRAKYVSRVEREGGELSANAALAVVCCGSQPVVEAIPVPKMIRKDATLGGADKVLCWRVSLHAIHVHLQRNSSIGQPCRGSQMLQALSFISGITGNFIPGFASLAAVPRLPENNLYANVRRITVAEFDSRLSTSKYRFGQHLLKS